MINVIIPMAGESIFFPNAENKYPKIFQEVHGKPMIEYVIQNLKTLRNPSYTFIVNRLEVQKYKLDNILKILTSNECKVVTQSNKTSGSVCSMLLAIDFFDHDLPLLILNSDQFIDYDLTKIINYFTENNLDAGVATFDSIHPQWSYVKIDGNKVTQTSEKQPISRNAIAGFYYFKSANLFFKYAMKMIEKDRNIDGKFYTSLVLNELILDFLEVGVYKLPSNSYFSFYSPERVEEFNGLKKYD